MIKYSLAGFLALLVALLWLVFFLLRLIRPANLRRFLSGPMQEIRSAKVLGQEIEFFNSLEAASENTQAALENLDDRLTTMESILYNRVLPKIDDDNLNLGL